MDRESFLAACAKAFAAKYGGSNMGAVVLYPETVTLASLRVTLRAHGYKAVGAFWQKQIGGRAVFLKLERGTYRLPVVQFLLSPAEWENHEESDLAADAAAVGGIDCGAVSAAEESVASNERWQRLHAGIEQWRVSASGR